MDEKWNARTQLLIGNNNIKKLKESKVVIIGLGGVGGTAAECLGRAGIEKMMIIDNDKIDITNINRQIIAFNNNIGEYKADEFAKRLKSINKNIDVIYNKIFCLTDNCDFIFDYDPCYIIDAIDTITTKIYLAKKSVENNINFISCMGMGNRTDPSLIKYGKIKETVGCGCVVSKIVRKELKKFNITDIDVVYSVEKPKKVTYENSHTPGSIACVPPVAGYFLAAKVINNIINTQ